MYLVHCERQNFNIIFNSFFLRRQKTKNKYKHKQNCLGIYVQKTQENENRNRKLKILDSFWHNSLPPPFLHSTFHGRKIIIKFSKYMKKLFTLLQCIQMLCEKRSYYKLTSSALHFSRQFFANRSDSKRESILRIA